MQPADTMTKTPPKSATASRRKKASRDSRTARSKDAKSPSTSASPSQVTRAGADTLVIQGRALKLSNLNTVLYPKAGFTKADVVDYYARIAPVLLPHLKDRPLTLKRYPDGVDGMFFYEKRCPSHRPDWVQTAPIWIQGRQETIPFCLANDLPTLVWAANLADLELHTSLATHQHPDRPSFLVFDLDPGEGANILNCCEVAIWLRDLLKSAGLQCLPKTSGSKGLQVYAPLNTPVTFEKTKTFARAVAEFLTREHPDKVLYRMEKKLRAGKVFVDWSQNDSHKTTVCVYSLRAKEQPTVSTPVSWKEIEKALAAADMNALTFASEAVLQRVSKQGDLFEPVLKLKQKLPDSAS
jgi:bifunctional non-homologous end joining protein LigD